MAGSQESYNKRDKEKKRLKKRLDKEQKQAERKANAQHNGPGNMIAYVDEYGQITDTPPDVSNRKVVDPSTIEIGVRKREELEAVAVRTGVVEFFNTAKGFGFIKEKGTQEKYFVHVNNVEGEIKETDEVTFEIERTFKGLNAVRVKKV